MCRSIGLGRQRDPQADEFLIGEKLRPALEAAGSSLERSVKAQVYLARIEDFPDFLDV